MDTQYPGAPELPEDEAAEPDVTEQVPTTELETPEPAQATPQLIKSTQSTVPESAIDDVPNESDEEDELNEHIEDPGDPDGVVAADEERKWKELHPAPAVIPATVRKRKRRLPKVLLTLVIIAALAAGAFWFGNNRANAPSAKSTQASQTKSPSHPATPTTVPTKHYDSTTYTLGFDYPQTWTVSDTTTKLTITSPSTQLTPLTGSNKAGHVVVTIQNQQTTVPGYPAGGALAALPSDKLTYKQPSAVQRAQTYLSYLGYANADGLDALYITGDNGYQQGQQVPMSDIVKGNPLVSVTFETCTSSDCSTGTPTAVTLLASSWKDASFSTQVTTLLQSMQLD